MKVKIFTKDATEKGSIELPAQFSEPARKDLVKRAVLAIQARNRTPYGTKPMAGKRASAYVSKRRRDFKGTYGIGQSRTPRKSTSRNGTRFNFVGAFAPQTVGGRQAHPPKASKMWEQKINEQENRKAIRSALSSTMMQDVVKARGHKVPLAYPFILSDDFDSISKTSELRKILLKLGFKDELERASVSKIRPGKGKLRGRKHKTKKSILFVTSNESALFLSAGNFPGFDIAVVDDINAELLAPGAQVGRATLFTESAIKKLADKKLFTSDFKGEEKKKEIVAAAAKPAKAKTSKMQKATPYKKTTVKDATKSAKPQKSKEDKQ
jgi:large subunit ribosomal protein L4e